MNFKVVLICIFLIGKDVELVFRYFLVILISSFERSLFKSIANVLLDCFLDSLFFYFSV